jgi:hypothetical protein
VTRDGVDDPEVGSLAEEAARLFDALGTRVRRDGAEVGSSVASAGEWANRAWHDLGEHLSTAGGECQYCPLCRLAKGLREASPDLGDQVGKAALAAIRAVTHLVARDAPARRAGVERIDLDDPESAE